MQLGRAVANAVGAGISAAGTNSARAAATANGVSAASQAAQGQFNQASANNANTIGDSRIAEQYGFNSGQAMLANDFTQNMWNQAAAWNEMMWEKQAAWNEMMWQKSADYNTAEAQKNRDWQKKMASTAYQRAVADMEKAGINPILASGGVGVSAGGSGGAASMGASSMSSPQMGGATGQMGSGGLLNGVSASESMYTGQMEYMAGMLGLLSTAFAGINSAVKAFAESGINVNVDGLAKDFLKQIIKNAGPTAPVRNAIRGAKDLYNYMTK